MTRKHLILYGVTVATSTALVVGGVNAFGGKSDNARGIDAARLVHGNTQPAPGTRPTVHVATEVDGGTYSVQLYRAADGRLCFGPRLPDGGQGITCYTDDELFADGPVRMMIGASQNPGADFRYWDVVWVYGVVQSNVSSLDLVSTTCASTPIRADVDGVFMHVFGESLLHRRVWPYRLIAHDAAGKLIYDHRTGLEPPQSLGRPAVLPAPAPSADCA